MQVVSYPEGLVAVVPLLAILVLKRERFKQWLYQWLLGFFTATFGLWQLCQRILGGFHDMDIPDATNIFSLSYYIGYASAFLGVAVYWKSIPKVKGLIAKERNN